MYRILGVVVVLSLGLLACSTLQTGILPGKWLRDDQPRVVITMGWQSHTSTHETGDLRVTFPSGERYFGSFVRLIDGVKLTNRMSVYDAWSMANVWPAGAGLGYYGVPGEWGGWGFGVLGP